MTMHYINHLGRRGVGFLHSGGKNSSDYLVGEIIKRNPSSILEIGCGTGATLISLASRSNIRSIIGIDTSVSQIKMAIKRVKYCQLEGHIQLRVIDWSNQLEFKNNSFDIIFAESVLGLLSDKDLRTVMKEVKRILKPNGIFISNDAIWKPTVTKKVIEAINFRGINDFGLIQSSFELVSKNEWKRFFSAMGFTNYEIIEINSLKKEAVTTFNSMEKKSLTFTRNQKFYSIFNPIQQLREIQYRIKLRFFHKQDAENLEHYIFVMQS